MKFNLEHVKEMKTPLHPNISLGLEKEFNTVDHTKYK